MSKQSIAMAFTRINRALLLGEAEKLASRLLPPAQRAQKVGVESLPVLELLGLIGGIAELELLHARADNALPTAPGRPLSAARRGLPALFRGRKWGL
jgi:hypothetical protein